MESHMENSLSQILIYLLSALEGQVLIEFSLHAMKTTIQEGSLQTGCQTVQK